MMPITGPVLLVGCGRMGTAMLGGWRASAMSADQIKAVEPFAATIMRRMVKDSGMREPLIRRSNGKHRYGVQNLRRSDSRELNIGDDYLS